MSVVNKTNTFKNCINYAYILCLNKCTSNTDMSLDHAPWRGPITDHLDFSFFFTRLKCMASKFTISNLPEYILDSVTFSVNCYVDKDIAGKFIKTLYSLNNSVTCSKWTESKSSNFAS